MSPEDIKQRILTELTGYDLDASGRGLLRPLVVYTTAEMAIPNQQLHYTGGVSVGPNVPAQLLAITFVAGILTIPINAIYDLRFSPFLLFLALFAISYLIFLPVKPLHRRIKFDHNGILLHDDRFEWAQTAGTYVMVKTSTLRRRSTRTFILIDTQGNLHRQEITNLSVSAEMFSTLVEYYRTQSPTN